MCPCVFFSPGMECNVNVNVNVGACVCRKNSPWGREVKHEYVYG